MYPFCKYSDGTEVVFSGIIKNENGEETIQIHFERPTENGFDSVRFELPSYKIIDKVGNYTDEEIEAIASGDVQKCYDLVTFTKSIRKGNFIYTPAYIYTATMEEIEAAGITAQELADRAFYFTTFSLSGEQLTAFQNKLLTYIAKSAQEGKFSGTYIIPYEATLSVPERIGNAEFIKENVTDINETNNPKRSESEASLALICYRSDSSDDGLAYVLSKLPSNPYLIAGEKKTISVMT